MITTCSWAPVRETSTRLLGGVASGVSSLKNLEFHYIQFALQSGVSSLAKHGGAYISAVYGSIKNPIDPDDPQEV